jgi:hypothetical protein
VFRVSAAWKEENLVMSVYPSIVSSDSFGLNEEIAAKDTRIRFNIRQKDISISASVTPEYFDANVLPIMTRLLARVAASEPGEANAAPAKSTIQPPPRDSIRTVIECLDATSGSDILKAAAISLTLLKGIVTFSGEELLEEAALAAGYWRKKYASDAKLLIDYLVSSEVLIEAVAGGFNLNPKEERRAAELLGRRIEPRS